MAAFDAERFDVGAQSLGHAQTVDGEQRHERVLPGRRQSGGDQERADLIAVKAGGVGLVVEARPAHVGRRGPFEQPLLLHVAVEAGHGAQATGDGRPRPSPGLEVAGEALDVRTAGGEQADVVLLAPGDELAQVQGVGVASQASVAGEERSERILLDFGEDGIDDSDVGRWRGGHVAPPGQAETRRPEQPGPSFV